LLTRLRRHEEAAFTEFFETYADRVYRLVMGLLKQADDAEEVVQATFVSAFEALDRFEPQAQLSTCHQYHNFAEMCFYVS
jgi:RNA polymerase sigma-70 factor (ECF subfamily)